MSVFPEDTQLFVIDLHYTVAPTEIGAEVDPLIPAHRAFLQKYYDQGVFVASGPKQPREGGVILACAKSRTKIEALVQEDPFHQRKVATYRITAFQPTMVGDLWGECDCGRAKRGR